jgi:endonuclease G
LLVDAKLVQEHASDIQHYLKTRQSGEGARLPAEGSDVASPVPPPTHTTTSGGFCADYLTFGSPTTKFLFCRKGYAFGFDTTHHLATWVIYRIRRDRLSPPRLRAPDVWYYDPDISETSQAGEMAYSNNEWDKGHLIPRNDLTWSNDAYNETWLYSVAAPRHASLNRGIWHALEQLTSNAVHNGKAIELYIITGPVFGPNTIKNYRGVVDLPDAFYRIAYDPSNNNIAAWLMPNTQIRDSATGVQASGLILDRYLTSVAEIERRTGLDFFSAMPAANQQRIETNRTSAAWLK